MIRRSTVMMMSAVFIVQSVRFLLIHGVEDRGGLTLTVGLHEDSEVLQFNCQGAEHIEGNEVYDEHLHRPYDMAKVVQFQYEFCKMADDSNKQKEV